MTIKKTFLAITTCAIISGTLHAAEKNPFISQQPMNEKTLQLDIMSTARKPLQPAVKAMIIGSCAILASTYNPEPCTKACCIIGGCCYLFTGSQEYGTIRENRKACVLLGLQYK